MKVKHCNKCKEGKPLHDFHVDRGKKDGRRGICKPCAIQDAKDVYDRDARKRYNREYKYGIDASSYQAMLDEQDSRCKLCGSSRPLQVDHCHETGRIRGLLCTTCNTGLGKLGDNLDGLLRAVEYLKQYVPQPVS